MATMPPEMAAQMGPWLPVLRRLQTLPPRTPVTLSLEEIAPPQAHGARLGSGLPRGQEADWRWLLPCQMSLHVRQYGDRYEVHLDEADPSTAPLQHLRKDAPHLFVRGAQVLAAVAAGGLAAVLTGPAVALAVVGPATIAAGDAAARYVLAGRKSTKEAP